MAALPWPVDTITEDQARSFFENGIDHNFPGSWRLESKYDPRLTDVVGDGTTWAYRFKMYQRAFVDHRGAVKQKKPRYVYAKSHPSKEAATARRFRDIYARLHRHAALFRTPAAAKRKAPVDDRDSRAVQRVSRKDPATAATLLNGKRMEEFRLEVSRRATLRPRSLQAEIPKRPACSQEAGAQAKRVRASAKPQISRKQLAHQKRIRQLSKEANENIANATKQLQAIQEAYEKAENAIHEEYSPCMKNLMLQMTSVYRYYVCAKILWQQRLKFIEALEIGQAAGRKPRRATVVQEVLRTQWKDTSALSATKLPCHATIVQYVKRWENDKSFHIADFARKTQSL